MPPHIKTVDMQSVIATTSSRMMPSEMTQALSGFVDNVISFVVCIVGTGILAFARLPPRFAQAFTPSLHVYLKVVSPGRPQSPSQDPPLAQQVRSPFLVRVHFEQSANKNVCNF